MKEVDQETRDRILETLKHNGGDYIAAAKSLALPAYLISMVDIVAYGKFNYTPEGKGPKHLQKYIVAIRSLYIHSGWDNANPAIVKARKDYDAGLVELATGRDGANIILYSLPRKQKDHKRKPYFSAPVLV